MRSTNASGLITLMHCLSATNADYDLKILPNSYMKRIVPEYHAYVNHLSKYKDFMPEVLTTKEDSLEKIRRRLVQLNLITDTQENNEHA